VGLTRTEKSVNCGFLVMATQTNPLPAVQEESIRDFEFPQREAAFFYGLFLRGHSADELRRDIQIPAPTLAKWDRETSREPGLRAMLERIVEYRRHVLAIFDSLIDHDSSGQRLQ
jgi:hypothetical protein